MKPIQTFESFLNEAKLNESVNENATPNGRYDEKNGQRWHA